MTGKGIMDTLWSAILLLLVVGLSSALPQMRALQMGCVPLVCAYLISVRGWCQGAWVALVGGLLLEIIWQAPHGSVILFFALLIPLALGIRQSHRGDLEEESYVTPWFGFFVGLIVPICLQIWLTLCFSLAGATLSFAIGDIVLTPIFGGVLGCIIYALMRAFDFEILKLTKEEVRDGSP